jgi:hypothetical protein
MSSIGSSTSTIVSFRGEEIELDEALRLLYIDLQGNLNNTQCSIRTLSLCEERDDTYLESLDIYHELIDYVDVLLELFVELKSVAKECLGVCPKEYKTQVKEIMDTRKEKIKREKEEKKLLEKQMKELEKLEIIQE